MGTKVIKDSAAGVQKTLQPLYPLRLDSQTVCSKLNRCAPEQLNHLGQEQKHQNNQEVQAFVCVQIKMPVSLRLLKIAGYLVAGNAKQNLV